MRRRLELLAYVLLASAIPAQAFELRSDSTFSVGGRFLTFVQTDRSSAPFPWDHTSRSPVDHSRLMLDLRAGRPTWGTLYLKGAATWRFSDGADGIAPFAFEQGDYLWERSGSGGSFEARAYANERRYFTGDMGGRLLDDDVIAGGETLDGARLTGDRETHYGLRLIGERGDVRYSGLIAGLDDAADGTRVVGWASAGWFGTHVQASAGFLHDSPASDTLASRGVLKGEVAGFYRSATVVVSWEQAGVDGDYSGSFDWDADRYSAMTPENAATFAEVRLHRLGVGDWGQASVWGRYRNTGASYLNDLSRDQPATTRGEAGIFLNHVRYAVDGRIFYRRDTRYTLVDRSDERVEAHAHAYLQRGYEVYVRGALGETRLGNEPALPMDFFDVALRRTLRRFLGGAYLWAGHNEIGNATFRVGGEFRASMGARSAFYARIVGDQDAVSSDAIYLRLEMRPTQNVFATISWGRSYIGDGPYLLEDTDIGRTGPPDNVYTITVRGDF